MLLNISGGREAWTVVVGLMVGTLAPVVYMSRDPLRTHTQIGAMKGKTLQMIAQA